MAASRCRFSYSDSDGVTHAVEVEADSRGALAVAEFRQDEILTITPAPMTEFCVTVLCKPIKHRIRFRKVQEWVNRQPGVDRQGISCGSG